MSWQPPAWLSSLLAKIRQSPRLYLGVPALVIALVAGGWWWATRPAPVKPGALFVSLSGPALTDYTKTPAVVHDLTVRFSAGAAPIKAIGGAAKGVTLMPDMPGAWTWRDDRTLVFAPAKDWPVGQAYELRIDPKLALAPRTELQQEEFEFSSAPFRANVQGSEFYQDPVDPALKKGVLELRFSHPIDAAQLERRIGLKLVDGAGTAQAKPGHVVSYDENRLKAFVHSQPLTLPDNGGTLRFDIAAGVTSVLGGEGSKEALTAQVGLPSLYSVNVDSTEATLVDNERFEPEQVLVVGFNNAMRDAEVAKAVGAWLLPAKNPAISGKDQPEIYGWTTDEVDEKILAKSQRIALTALPGEREFIETHSFRFQAPPKRLLYVRVNKGLKAFGGFLLGADSHSVVTVPEYPQVLRFVGQGALLSLRGERRVSIVSRNVARARLEVARVLPEQLQHLVFNNQGDYGQVELGGIEADSLVERMEKRLSLPIENPAKAHYEGVDLAQFLAPSRRGVFLLSLRTMSENDDKRSAEETLANDVGQEQDSRLVVLTDLGIIAKKALDGRRDVFVQSLAQGSPIAGAQVRVIARNGETLASASTDADGRAQLPSLDGFRREKAPVMLTVARADDFSFLPLDASGQTLDYSRFDIGGEPNDLEAGALNAFLFSDRGLYRPGDTINLGMIVRASDWKRSLAGLPMELVLTNPLGTVVRRDAFKLDDAGLATSSHATQDSAPSGTWRANLYLVGKDDDRTAVGETTVQVREFAPDTMRVSAKLSAEARNGWIRPEELKAIVAAENLFGTPAQQRRVEATMELRPAFASFPAYPGYAFHDPQRAKEGYSESLTDGRTDADGHATFALDLSRYARATYQLNFLARVFEPGSGRNVAAQVTALVSSNDYLVGIKSIDALDYVTRNAKRNVSLLAIGPDGNPRKVDGLRAVVVEKRFVSVLTRQESGLYRYVSHERRYPMQESALVLGAAAQSFALPTGKPGDYVLEIRNADDEALNQIAYSVAGAANVSRSLDRNAELALTLSKAAFKPGETIEVSVRAPYTGSGLITIERDRVYAQAWFRADTTSSVQRIRVPEGFEGNGYVNVQFLRDPSSDEIFMSPLSYGIAPFAVDRSARVQPLTISAPKVAKPGAAIPLEVTTQGKARVLVFAVDEGILQVARYRVGDPLDYFFRKKMLQVDTSQILDLLLPEFSRVAALSAPGGDEGSGLAKHLNPFKRRAEKPAVWWSGIVDVDGSRKLSFRLPDHFNGQVRLTAVAVTPERVGLAESQMLLRGDFVLTPTVPTHVAPGDEFDIPVGVANTIGGAKQPAMVAVSLQLPAALTLVGTAPKPVSIAPGGEASVVFHVRAGAALGAVPVVARAQSGKYVASRRIELSLRPATVARHDLRVGRADKQRVLDDLRSMYEQHSTRRLSASVSPLVAVDGLSSYLLDYPHYCTEQVLSQAIPGLVYASHPELGNIRSAAGASGGNVIDVLRSRQNGEGGLGTWSATPQADAFATSYAALYLLEARDRGQPVPDDLLRSLNRYLETMAADPSKNDLASLRQRAFAVYLLVRQGRNASNLLGAVHEQLKRDQPKTWRDDTAALLLAASYQQLQQDKPARELASRSLARANSAAAKGALPYAAYYDNGIEQAWTVYLLNRHFPLLAKQLKSTALDRLLDPLRNDSYNTLSSALSVLAFDAYASANVGSTRPQLLAAGKDGKPRRIGQDVGVISRGTFTGADRRLWVVPTEKTPAWFLLEQAGFDRALPKAPQSEGLEISRDYLDDAGKPITSLTLGQEMTVRLRVRAIGSDWRYDIAIVDLLPGGFEAVMQAPPSVGDDESYDEEGEGAAASAMPALALPGSTFVPAHLEPREDRVVLYGSASAQVQEFRYRIRANNAGRFVVPSIQAESMYERAVHAQGGPAGELQVTAPTP